MTLKSLRLHVISQTYNSSSSSENFPGQIRQPAIIKICQNVKNYNSDKSDVKRLRIITENVKTELQKLIPFYVSFQMNFLLPNDVKNTNTLILFYLNKAYKVKEIFYTLQGEGGQAGRPSVFCRFTGCNLWSGREEDRAQAICQFCDTDFWGTDGINGGRYTAEELAAKVATLWQPTRKIGKPYVVCTGGEPLLQLDKNLVEAFHNQGFEVAVETNGTLEAPPGLDWICVSPKAGADLVLKAGNELKLVFPQAGASPQLFEHLDFDHFFLQPMDGLEREHNTQLTLQYCLENPQWRLSLQTHKLLNIP